MNWLDLVILAALAVGLAYGFSTGAVRQVAGICGVVIAFALSVQLMDEVGRMVVRSLAVSPAIAPVVGFVLVFLAVRLVFAGLVHAVESVLSALRLTALNRLAGGALGAFQAALLLSLAFLVLSTARLPDAAARQEATLYEPVAAVLPASWAYVQERVPRLKDLSEQFGQRLESELFDEP